MGIVVDALVGGMLAAASIKDSAVKSSPLDGAGSFSSLGGSASRFSLPLSIHQESIFLIRLLCSF